MYDVIVVGGGPAGSRTAARLAGMGHRVAVLEKEARAGTRTCCTGIIGRECARVYNIDDSVILKKASSAVIFSPSGKALGMRREETQACILDRAAFDRMMMERAVNQGAEYLPGRTVNGLKIREDGVEIKALRDGEKVDYKARAAVIASGFGAGPGGHPEREAAGDFVIGAQAEVTTAGASEVEVYLGRQIAPGFFGWMVPTSLSTARVGLLCREKPRDYLQRLIATLYRQGKLAAREARISYGRVPLQPPRRTSGERVIMVGDAAGQVKPTTGGGIYYGLLGADIAADTLDRGLRSDDLSARSLAGYERRWRQKLGREIKTGYRARRFFERLNDRQIEGLFEIIKASGIDKAVLDSGDVSFDWHGKAIPMLLGKAVISRLFGRTPSGVVPD